MILCEQLRTVSPVECLVASAGRVVKPAFCKGFECPLLGFFFRVNPGRCFQFPLGQVGQQLQLAVSADDIAHQRLPLGKLDVSQLSLDAGAVGGDLVPAGSVRLTSASVIHDP